MNVQEARKGSPMALTASARMMLGEPNPPHSGTVGRDTFTGTWSKAYRATTRGFSMICWRTGELGYALVSDLDHPELTQLAAKL